MPLSQIDSTGLAAKGVAPANMHGGAVLQVVNNSVSGSTTLSGSTWSATNLSVTISPTLANSKILVFGQLIVNGSQSTSQPTITLYRGNTNLVSAPYGLGDIYTQTGGYMEGMLPFSLIDFPATTSAITYTLYGSNKSTIGTANIGDTYRLSVITAMEIAG